MHNIPKTLLAIGLPGLLTIVFLTIPPVAGYTVLLILFLLCVTVFATRSGLTTALICGLTSALCFNYFFTEPYYSLIMVDVEDVVVASVFLVVSALIGHQTDLLRRRMARQAEIERELVHERSERDRELLRSALTSSLSHDLKTPLSTMIGAASSLVELGRDLSEENRSELLSSILSEARRLEKYIQNLLDMTRLGHGDLPIDRQPIAVSEIIHVVKKRIINIWPEARLKVHVPANLPLIEVHPALLEQALYNLVDNAVKFNQPGADVAISARATDSDVIIDIVDHGPGIPTGYRDIAFDFFETLGRGDHHKAGEGLGLAIAKGMIGAHGGKLMILDALHGDSGTCMRISLPYRETLN